MWYCFSRVSFQVPFSSHHAWHLYGIQQYLILCSNEMLLLQDTDRKIKGKNVNDLSKTTCESEIEYKRHSLFVLPLNCPEIKSDIYQRSFQSEARCLGISSQGLRDAALRSCLRSNLFLYVLLTVFVQSENPC